jgi:hypothetical protein
MSKPSVLFVTPNPGSTRYHVTGLLEIFEVIVCMPNDFLNQTAPDLVIYDLDYPGDVPELKHPEVCRWEEWIEKIGMPIPTLFTSGPEKYTLETFRLQKMPHIDFLSLLAADPFEFAGHAKKFLEETQKKLASTAS